MKLYEISHSEHFADTKQMSFPPLALGWPQDLILGGGVEGAHSNSTAKKSHHRHRLSEERTRSGTQARVWDQGKNEGHIRKKTQEAETQAELPLGKSLSITFLERKIITPQFLHLILIQSPVNP